MSGSSRADIVEFYLRRAAEREKEAKLEVLWADGRARAQFDSQDEFEAWKAGLKEDPEIVSIKRSAVSSLIQTTQQSAAPTGHEVHAPLTRNPYLDPLADPDDAAEYENGYQYAQQLGHQLLAQARPEDVVSWQAHPESWKRGFATAASRLGAGRVADMLFAEAKEACWATEYLRRIRGG